MRKRFQRFDMVSAFFIIAWDLLISHSHFFSSKTKNDLIKHCVKSIQIQSFFWSVFSCIRTEYGEILRISPYSVRMPKNTDQKKLRIWKLFTQWKLLTESRFSLFPTSKDILKTNKETDQSVWGKVTDQSH